LLTFAQFLNPITIVITGTVYRKIAAFEASISDKPFDYSGCHNYVPFGLKSGSGIFSMRHINPKHHLCPTDW